MAEFELQLQLERAVKYANSLVENKVLCADEVRDMFTDATNKIDIIERAQTFKAGNAYTGDVSAMKELCDTFKILDHNWIEGTCGSFKFQSKVFSETSTHGIKNGRISKLSVHDKNQEQWGFEGCFINYDRGWDIYPKNDEALAFLNQLLEAVGDDPMTDDDLMYYTIYLYDTVEDFENRKWTDHIGSFTYKEDALAEAKEYPEYERIKIISSDSEDIEIIENEPIEET